MQRVQRKFGKLLPRTADESQVALLLKDFDDADKMLERIIEASKAWRDAWRDILTTQHRLIHGFQSMYAPIAYADDSNTSREMALSPENTMQRTQRLQDSYQGLKDDLLEEVNAVDARLVKPAMEAKDCIQPLKKVIKKRGDRKLDFEKYQQRVDNHRKKTKRSDRDNAYLAKAEVELERATDEYQVADDQLKSGLPPIIQSAFSLLPHLLSAQIITQNNLLGHYYTTLHEYSVEVGFLSPPPPASETIGTFNRQFRPILRDVEAFGLLANGRVSRQSFGSEISAPRAILNDSASRSGYPQRASSSLSVAASSSLRPASAGPVETREPSPEQTTRPKISSIPSQTSLSLATPNYSSSASESDVTAMVPAGPRPDYFVRDRQPSSSSIASIASKKKPPPPPPPKRNFTQQGTWVTAIYDFAGQSQGDLVFKEGDRIRVLKKTDSTDDWWEGELQGIKGSFPANYCRAI